MKFNYHESLNDAIKRSLNHLPKSLHKQLQDLIFEFEEIFRTKLGKDPPVDMTPMIIEFENKEIPVKVRQRTYSPEQLDFLKKKCDQLIHL